MSKKFVYFMRPVGMNGPIKIGCTGFIRERLMQLTVWSPFPLEVLYMEEADHTLERNLHRCFADCHSHHEWFHPSERLLATIERLQAGEKIASAVDLSDERGSIFGNRFKGTPDIMAGYRSYLMRIIWASKKARKANSDACYTPADIDKIMDTWVGGFTSGFIAKVRPDQEQFNRLEEFLSNPEKYLLTAEERWPASKARRAA